MKTTPSICHSKLPHLNLKNFKTLFVATASLCSSFILHAEEPRQFKAWGSKAPFLLGAYDPVKGKRHIDSISIPKEFKQVLPATNTTAPEISDEVKKRGFIIFNEHYMKKVYPCTQPLNSQMDSPLKAIATPGEYVTLTFSVRTLEPLYNLRINIPSLQNGKNNGIPDENVDIRLVRCLPWKSEKTNEYILEPRYMEKCDEFDIFDIAENYTQRFWITIKIPEDLPADIYKSNVSISFLNKPEYSLPLAIKVLPFTLMKPDPYKDITFAIFSNHNDPRLTGHGANIYNENMLRDFVDMVEHGMTSAGYLRLTPFASKVDGKLVFRFDKPGYNNLYSVEKVMDCYIRSGFPGPMLYQKGPWEWTTYAIPGIFKVEKLSPEFDEIFKAYTKAVYDKIKQNNWPEFIFILGDEPGGHADRLKWCMHTGRLAKEICPGIKTANLFNGEWFGAKDWLHLKPVTDINITNYTNERFLKESEAAGYKDLWLYNICAGYPSDYRGHRVAYGFFPWKIKAKGIAQFIYQSFSNKAGKDFTAYDAIHAQSSEGHYALAYPAADGPLPSPEWECVRQGTYDYRYIYTLFKLIEKMSDTENPKLKTEIDSARKLLDEISAKFPYDYRSENGRKHIDGFSPEMLDVYRWKIASQIIRIKEITK